MMVWRLETGVGTGFGRFPDSLAKEFSFYVVGSEESLKDLSKVVT